MERIRREQTNTLMGIVEFRTPLAANAEPHKTSYSNQR